MRLTRCGDFILTPAEIRLLISITTPGTTISPKDANARTPQHKGEAGDEGETGDGFHNLRIALRDLLHGG